MFAQVLKKSITDWMREYGVSLKKPNKRFAIKQEDRIQRLIEYLKNVWRIRKYFLHHYGIDPPIINGDQIRHKTWDFTFD